jgi:hypothetical protein
MVVAPDGILYVNTWSGRYYGDDKPHVGGFLVALQDKTGQGKADVVERFGETAESIRNTARHSCGSASRGRAR